MELVHGYGVYVTVKQLDQVINESQGSQTKIIQNLMTTFFTPSVLAKCSYFGRKEDGNPRP